MALKNFLDFFLTENSEEEINSLISGFEDLGINEKPKVWFFSADSRADGFIEELLVVEATTEIEAIKMVLKHSLINYEEEEDGSISTEDGDPIKDLEDLATACEDYYSDVNYSFSFIDQITHPFPSRYQPGTTEYSIYRQYHEGLSNAFKEINKTNAELKRKYGIGLEDL
jgi:hypothetical protein